MIARIWRGATPVALADEYVGYLRVTGVRDYRATEGNRGVYVLRRISRERAEFLLISLWDSWEAIRRFAGDNLDQAKYYPQDTQYLLELEPTVDHFEVVESSLS